ncbi:MULTISPECIES: hypothetical protein [Bradyrhizobium]|uniref:hypothetical protein n=1 Tax=Bradyrhizobium pachyrhizi TaxID=280333 RepID=UPI00047F88B9
MIAGAVSFKEQSYNRRRLGSARFEWFPWPQLVLTAVMTQGHRDDWILIIVVLGVIGAVLVVDLSFLDAKRTGLAGLVAV